MNSEKILAVCNHIERNVTDEQYFFPDTHKCFIGHGVRAGILKAQDYNSGIAELGFGPEEFHHLIGSKGRKDAVRIMRRTAYTGLPREVRAIFSHHLG